MLDNASNVVGSAKSRDKYPALRQDQHNAAVALSKEWPFIARALPAQDLSI